MTLKRHQVNSPMMLALGCRKQNKPNLTSTERNTKFWSQMNEMGKKKIMKDQNGRLPAWKDKMGKQH